MRSKYLLLATVVGALVMFAWQTVSNAALPWHNMTMRPFTADSATAVAIRAASPVNGVYYSKYGVFAAVSISPSFADQTSNSAMMPMLARQAMLDLVVAFVLAMLVLRLAPSSAVSTGVTVAIAALAVSAVIELSNKIWYGFSTPFALVNVIDQTISFFLTGLVVGVFRARLERGMAPDTAERRGVRAEGGLPGTTAGTGARV